MRYPKWKNVVSGATIQKDLAKIDLVGVDNTPGNAASILPTWHRKRVLVNDIIQTEVSPEKANLSFTVPARLQDAPAAIDEIRKKYANSTFVREDIAEVSVVGVGMRSHCGVAEKMFKNPRRDKINIDSITTSEIRISCIVDIEQAEKALVPVCQAFQLDKPAADRNPIN